jgi:hypothetical protein
MTDAERKLALVLQHDIRPCDGGFHILGLWCGLEPFPTREAAEARYFDWLRRTYGNLDADVPPPPRLGG